MCVYRLHPINTPHPVLWRYIMDNNETNLNIKKQVIEYHNKNAATLSKEHCLSLRSVNSKFTVLLVEDDNIISKFAQISIRDNFRYSYVAVKDGLAAVKAVKDGGIDFIFMDIGMYPVDGIQATRLIRAYELENKLNKVTIIGQSAYGDEMLDEALAAGMNMLLSKEKMSDFDYIESLLAWFLHEKSKHCTF